MKIRSITCFTDLPNRLDEQSLKLVGDFIHEALPAFVDCGYEVQSTRLATIPFPRLAGIREDLDLASLAQLLEALGSNIGYAYVSLGPALPEQPLDYGLIPEALAVTHNVFFGGLMTTAEHAVSLRAVTECAQVIQRASTLSVDGFANLRFAALAGVKPGAPFFPAAYHGGGEPVFALATEAADLAVIAFSQAASLQEGRRYLVNLMEAHARQLTDTALQVEARTGVRFGGIDFSLAPFPYETHSLGTALERLGVPAIGMHGSTAAAAILADTIDQAHFMRAGFSGLMLPVMEDATLAQRAAEQVLTVTDLLLFSAMCGTGLDTIPLPGDTSADQLYAVLLDLASLSMRLGKPLTARLMPIPGKHAGDPTGFDFAYFANSRVMTLRAGRLEGLLGGSESFTLHPRIVR